MCAASIGDRSYSGFAGQADFIRGAGLVEGRKPVIALQATTLGGKASRIVTRLSEGAMVALTQAHIHSVVTEYGIAGLYGKNLRQRAEAPIAIAHPDFREELYAFDDEHHHI